MQSVSNNRLQHLACRPLWCFWRNGTNFGQPAVYMAVLWSVQHIGHSGALTTLDASLWMQQLPMQLPWYSLYPDVTVFADFISQFFLTSVWIPRSSCEGWLCKIASSTSWPATVGSHSNTADVAQAAFYECNWRRNLNNLSVLLALPESWDKDVSLTGDYFEIEIDLHLSKRAL